MFFLVYAYKGADQPTHPCSLTSTFIVATLIVCIQHISFKSDITECGRENRCFLVYA